MQQSGHPHSFSEPDNELLRPPGTPPRVSWRSQPPALWFGEAVLVLAHAIHNYATLPNTPSACEGAGGHVPLTRLRCSSSSNRPPSWTSSRRRFARLRAGTSQRASGLWLGSTSAERWLARRTNFARSVSVMSMVGYILGLGDRHLSNIMLDQLSGHVLHIDFGDCFEVGAPRKRAPLPIRPSRCTDLPPTPPRRRGAVRGLT